MPHPVKFLCLCGLILLTGCFGHPHSEPTTEVSPVSDEDLKNNDQAPAPEVSPISDEDLQNNDQAPAPEINPAVLSGTWQSDCTYYSPQAYTTYRYTFATNSKFAHQLQYHASSDCSDDVLWQNGLDSDKPAKWQDLGPAESINGVKVHKIEIETQISRLYAYYDNYLVQLDQGVMYISQANSPYLVHDRSYRKISE